MGKSLFQTIAEIGAGFDWITPASHILAGYNTVEMDETLNENACKAKVKELKRQGIKATVDFTGNGWRVISKRQR